MLRAGWEEPAPHCEFWIRNNGNQLCSNCDQLCYFFNFTGPFFQFPGGGGGSRNSASLIANFGFETTRINCAPIVLNCAAIFFNCTGPFFQLPGRWFSELSHPLPPLQILDSKQRESIMLQLCSIVLHFFQLYPPFFSITRGWVSELRSPIANVGFETTRINCAPVVLNCAEIFPSVTDPTMQLRRGWGILRIQPFKPPIADFLTQSLEVEFCGIVLTFFLKISTSS